MPIIVENLSHTYMQSPLNAHAAISDITLRIDEGEFVGLIGHTGSGKSTLIQHLNGLLEPSGGRVLVDGFDLSDKAQRKKARALVGMSFQYPDYQLFDNTVIDDVSFGPKNMGLSEDEARRRAADAMELVGLDVSQFAQKSPFELSGGEKRRAALAGIIAMRPKYLVLDEPMAGLDPSGRRGIMELIQRLRLELGCAVIMVSHSMEDIARHADRVILLCDGMIRAQGLPCEIFRDSACLISLGLEAPQAARLCDALRERGCSVPAGLYTNELFIDWLGRTLNEAQ